MHRSKLDASQRVKWAWPGYSSAGALVMARTQKRWRMKNDAPDLMAYAIDLERRALDAIKPGLSELPDEPVKSP